MRILHTADWHLGKKLNDFNRLDEQRQVLNEICDIVEKENVDVVLIAGDLYDTFNPPNEAIELLYRTLHRLANNGKRPVIAIAGNHDSADRIEAPDPLARECGIIFSGYPDSKVPVFKLPSGIEVTRSDHGFLELRLPKTKELLRLITTPYANEARLKSFFGTQDSHQTFRNILSEKWQKLADKYCDKSGVNLLVAHLFVTNGKDALKEPEDERSVVHVGGAQPIYTSDIPSQIDYTALGHLHRFHNLAKVEEPPVIYSGSLLEYSLSETEQQKYVSIIETKAGEKVKVKKEAINAGKRLHRKRFESVASAIDWLSQNQDTFVEITLKSDSFLTAQIKRELYEAHKAIIGIIPEIQTKNVGEQQKQTNLQENIEDLFERYFHQKHDKPLNEDLKALLKEVLNQEE